jgi:hypothetical protein
MPQQGLALIRMAAQFPAGPALAACTQPAPMPAAESPPVAARNASAPVGAQCVCIGVAVPYGSIR